MLLCCKCRDSYKGQKFNNFILSLGVLFFLFLFEHRLSTDLVDHALWSLVLPLEREGTSGVSVEREELLVSVLREKNSGVSVEREALLVSVLREKNFWCQC